MTDNPPPRRRPSRAIVASDSRLLRDGLADALSRSIAIRVVASVADAYQVRAAISDLEPDIVLLDIEMLDSLGLVGSIQAGTRSSRIVAFTVSEIDEALARYIEAGIDACVTRRGSLNDLVTTVERVARDETNTSPKLAAS